MIERFTHWLAGTALSSEIQDISWLIPLVQTVHILSVAIVLSSVAILNFRVAGWAGRRVSIVELADRFLPWVWGAVIVLALTGTVLIVGEPGRSLLNVMFKAKMALLLVSIVIAACFQYTLRDNAAFWQMPPPNRRRAIAFAASVSLSLWVGIVICGRLIAYVGQDN